MMSEWQETELGILPANWLIQKVDELVNHKILAKPLDGNHGEIHPKGNDFKNFGIPFVMASDVVNGKVDLIHCKFISEEQAKTLNKGFSVTGDVLLTHKATLGRTAIVGNLQTPYIMLTPQVTYYRVVNEQKLNNRYLKYYFDSSSFQDTLANHGDSGSTRAYVGITAQRDLPICIPPINEQQAIANILSSLDNKIDLLHRQNKTLEAMAETLFRQWFIEEASEDWEEKPLGDVVTISYGKNLPTKNLLSYGYPVFGANGQIGFYDRYSYEEPQVLVSCRGEASGKVNISLPNSFITNNSLTLERNKRPEISFEFLKYWAITYDFKLHVSGSAQPQITIDGLYNAIFTVPNRERIDKFTVIVKSNEEKRLANFKQIQTLEKLRDNLLPKLMSGEIRVKF
jgi:type I restriction enzyme S subunit